LFVAGCAAFFSIKGLMVLFAGSAIAIATMASSLEIGKLVAASFLHRQWHHISWMLKTYLCIAIFVLMGITSLGIFGFLTNAYQEHASVVNNLTASTTLVEAKKKSSQEAIVAAEERIKLLYTVRADQELRVKEAGNYKLPREQAYKAIAEANAEISAKEKVVTEQRTELLKLESELADINKDLNTKTDIGSFRFIAKAMNVEIDVAVRYFILALVFVFDPLAVCLVLALNILLEQRTKKVVVPIVVEQPVPTPVIAPPAPQVEVAPPAPEPVHQVVNTPEGPVDVLPGETVEQAIERKRRRKAGVGDSVITSTS